MNTKTVLFTLGIAMCLVVPAQAHDREEQGRHRNKFHDYAQVIDVQPVYRTVSVPAPARECWKEDVRKPVKRHVRDEERAQSTVVGGIIGGALGHHFGGNDPGAVIAGTIVGAAIGHNVAEQQPRSRDYYLVEQRRCQEYTEYHEEKQQDGYMVTYRYHGEVYSAHMDRRPGRRIRVKVSVEPVFK